MIKLKIEKKELEKIKNKTKKIDFRKPSLYNKRKLLIQNSEGKFEARLSPCQIEFQAGYSNDSEKIIVNIEKIVPFKFTQNYNEFNGEPIEARAGECIIAIYINY
jgi:hypothetical protein